MEFFMMKDPQVTLSYVLGTCLALVALHGCGDSKFKNLSNSELQDKFSMCESASGLSPGGAIICDNVRRECDDRAAAANRTICF